MYGWRISSYPKLMRRSRTAPGTISCSAASSNDPGPKVIGRTGTACVEQRDDIVSSTLQHLNPPEQRSCNGLTGWQNTAQIRASCDDCWIDDLRKSRGLHSISAYKHGLYIYRSMPAGVAQSSHAFVGGTLSTWARWRIPVNKSRKGIRNADQTLTARGERADRIVGSPSW